MDTDALQLKMSQAGSPDSDERQKHDSQRDAARQGTAHRKLSAQVESQRKVNRPDTHPRRMTLLDIPPALSSPVDRQDSPSPPTSPSENTRYNISHHDIVRIARQLRLEKQDPSRSKDLPEDRTRRKSFLQKTDMQSLLTSNPAYEGIQKAQGRRSPNAEESVQSFGTSQQDVRPTHADDGYDQEHIAIRHSPSYKSKYGVLEAEGYTVGQTIGTGCFSVVKKGYDHTKCRDVAIKVMQKKTCPQEYLNKFLPRELEMLVGLSHPNLLKWYQIIETNTRFMIVMDLCANADLLEFIRKETYLDESSAGHFFYDIYQGVSYIHGQMVAHRDLKCENLLIDSDYHIRITDFGFSCRVHLDVDGEVELSKTFCGSYAYAAPEVLKGIPYNPFSADIWSMGVILFVMVYGLLPFDDTDFQTLQKLVSRPVVYPRKPKVSPELKQMVSQMLKKSKSRIVLSEIKEQLWFEASCYEGSRPTNLVYHSSSQLQSHSDLIQEIFHKPSVSSVTSLKPQPHSDLTQEIFHKPCVSSVTSLKEDKEETIPRLDSPLSHQTTGLDSEASELSISHGQQVRVKRFSQQESETVRNHLRQQPEERRASTELGFLTAHHSKNFHLCDPEPEDKRHRQSNSPSSDISIKDQPAPSVGEYVQESTVFPDQSTYAPILNVTQEVVDTQSDQQQEEAIAHENKENETNIVLVITGTSTELKQLPDGSRNGVDSSVTEKSDLTSTESREAPNRGVSQDKAVNTCKTRPTTAKINKISGMEVTSSRFGRPAKTSIRSPSQSLPDIEMFGKKQELMLLEKDEETKNVRFRSRVWEISSVPELSISYSPSKLSLNHLTQHSLEMIPGSPSVSEHDQRVVRSEQEQREVGSEQEQKNVQEETIPECQEGSSDLLAHSFCDGTLTKVPEVNIPQGLPPGKGSVRKNGEKEETFQKHPIPVTFSAPDFSSVSSQYWRPFQKLKSEPTTIPLGTTRSQEIPKCFNTVSSSGMGLNRRKVIKEDSWPADPLPRVFSSRSHARKHFERRHTVSQTRLIPETVAHQTCPSTTPCTRHSEEDAQLKTEKPSSWEDSQPSAENVFQFSQYKHVIEKKATENSQYKQPTHEKVYQSNQRALRVADKASQCSQISSLKEDKGSQCSQLRHHTEDKASQCSEYSPPQYSLSTTHGNQYTHVREWTSPQHGRYNQLSEEECVPSQCHHRLQPGSSQSTRMRRNQFIFNITCTIGQIEIKNKTEYRPNQIEESVKKL